MTRSKRSDGFVTSRRGARQSRPRVHADVVAELGRQIVSGAVRPGETLPGEIALAARFKVSRPAMREGLKVLGAKGLVQPRTPSGTIVREARHWNMLDSDILALAVRYGRIKHLLSSLMEARILIEPAAAAMAAKRATPDDLRAMSDALDTMRATLNDLPEHQEADYAFHAAIIAASGNLIFGQLLGVIRMALLESFRVTHLNEDSHRRGMDLHGAILSAIKAKAPERAHKATQSLLKNAQTILDAAAL